MTSKMIRVAILIILIIIIVIYHVNRARSTNHSNTAIT